MFQAEQGGLFVLRVGGRNVDDVDVRVGGQGLIARVALRNAELVGEGVRLLLGARADRDQFGVADGLEARRELVGDAAGTEDAPADGAGSDGCQDKLPHGVE